MAADVEQLNYRERSVDETLQEHERRITRLEKVTLVGIGYVLSDANLLIEPLLALLL